MKNLFLNCRVKCARLLLPGLLVVGASALAAQEGPRQPLEEIVQRFARKELDYARGHALYQYKLTVRLQELDGEGNVIGELEQESEVTFDRLGKRTLRTLSNPRSDLAYLNIQRIELADLARIPLFIAGPSDIEKYDITYLTSERVDEVQTYLFRLRPKGVPRPRDELFEGVIWVDADQLDIVRVQGRLRPPHNEGALGRYFQQLEVYREPVDEFLLPTFIRGDDIIRAIGGDGTVRVRLVVRFSDHKRVREPGSTGTVPKQ